MSEFSWMLDKADAMGLGAIPLFVMLWWMEHRKVKDLADRISTNTNALTVLTVTVNTLFQTVLASGARK